MEYTYKGYKITIEMDQNPESPRQWDNLGTIVYKSRWVIGDEELSVEEIKSLMQDKDNIWLPYYLMDHGGISVSTGSFGCSWDSGQVGIIYVSKDKIRKEFGIKKVTKKWEEKIKGYLENEVNTMNQYLQGDVYGYIIETLHGQDIDSCWGFYGEEYCKQEAESYVDTIVPKSIKYVRRIVEDNSLKMLIR
jgi:hypothetical protein